MDKPSATHRERGDLLKERSVPEKEDVVLRPGRFPSIEREREGEREREETSLKTLRRYFRLLNDASRPAMFYFGALNGSLQIQNPLEKVGGEAPHLFYRVLR